MTRYAHAGLLYDLVSVEPLYRPSRRRLVELLALEPGATVVDVGCGTGRNLPLLRRAVGPRGRVIGVDASASMLATARRRIDRTGAGDVTLLAGDALDVDAVLRAGGVEPDDVDALVITFVLSLLADDAPFWATIDDWSTRRPRRAGLADLGAPDAAPPAAQPLLRAMTALGGGDTARRPWERLLARTADGRHEEHLGGHVHLAVGTCGTRTGLGDDGRRDEHEGHGHGR